MLVGNLVRPLWRTLSILRSRNFVSALNKHMIPLLVSAKDSTDGGPAVLRISLRLFVQTSALFEMVLPNVLEIFRRHLGSISSQRISQFDIPQ